MATPSSLTKSRKDELEPPLEEADGLDVLLTPCARLDASITRFLEELAPPETMRRKLATTKCSLSKTCECKGRGIIGRV